MVFFRVDWDFRWWSYRKVLQASGGPDLVLASATEPADSSSSILDDTGDADTPLELTELVEVCRWLSGRLGVGLSNGEEPPGGGPDQWPGLLEEGLEWARVAEHRLNRGRSPAAAGRGSRDVLVVPGGWHREDSWAALHLALSRGGALVLAPEEGAWAWTVLWARPTLIIAHDDQLDALAAEVAQRRGRKRRSALRSTRALFRVPAWSSLVPISDSQDFDGPPSEPVVESSLAVLAPLIETVETLDAASLREKGLSW